MEILRKRLDGITFTTDMMVGFPSESDEDFRQTLDFTRKARFLDMHIFAYSRRKNTPADTYPDQVDESVKRERSFRLAELRDEITREILTETVTRARPLSVVFETRSGNTWTGHSAEYIKVIAECEEDIHGVMSEVIPVAVGDKYISGKIITHMENGNG